MQLPEHMPVVALQALLVQVVPLRQLPLSSQLRGVCSTQPFAPGLHEPLQRPSPVHTYGQAVSAFQIPVRSHERGVAPLQVRAPGLHSPLQVPSPLHTYGHADCGSQVPISLHSSGMPAMLQRRAPGEHVPPQLPLEQMFGHLLPEVQLPVSSHVCGTSMSVPPQRCSPGLHMPLHLPWPLHT
jgi:hypothetical protein